MVVTTMFVTPQAAAARLKSKDNILRPSATLEESESAESATLEKAVEEVESGDDQDEPSEDTTEIEAPHPAREVLDKLDSLLNPKVKGRARYRERLASQVGIAETGLILGQTASSHLFDLSIEQAHSYTHGSRDCTESTAGIQKPELKAAIDKTRAKIAVKAADRLNAVLTLLDDDKLSKVKRATNLSKIGKDMAVILDKVTPKEAEHKDGLHFHIYRPEMSQVNKYETVEVGPTIVVEKSDSQ